MLLKYLPTEPKFKFMKFRMAAFALSLILIVGSIAMVVTRGLNFGIDFVGGVVVEVETPTKVDIGEIRSALSSLDLAGVEVTEIKDNLVAEETDTTIALIKTKAPEATGDEVEAAVQATAAGILTALKSEFGDIEERRKEAVGPKVSGELMQDGIMALVVALSLMLVYIWFRFQWQFSVGAVLALVHDVILTIGMFAVTQFEFNLSTIAALLTIVGYSMNDTVVVYDRVREELRRYKKMSQIDVIDMSVNRTLSRTLLTSGTTLLALISIFLLGGEVLRGFSFAMIWGVVIGTYSSIFIASAILLHTGMRRSTIAGGEAEPDPQGAQV
ncbi:protein translocase subunit SecF [Hirschia maritima]|uniref:protein translocase subunit SecF n=1 Tax=Hirschia maritima TaxID=1121961 RepID=UPI00037AF100|nr:protein translocase subunit SecF [Hirschia maritima]